MVVRDNLRALMVIHAIVFAGFVLLGVATCAFEAGVLAPLPWMILAGAGLYMAYTPFNAMLFDRLIAYSGRVATAGFLIYVADASGYVGSVALLLARNFGGFHLDWLPLLHAERLRHQHRRRRADGHGRGLLQPRPRTSGPGRCMSPAPFASIEVLEKFLENLAGSPSDEEGLGELEHLLQCADLLRFGGSIRRGTAGRGPAARYRLAP